MLYMRYRKGQEAFNEKSEAEIAYKSDIGSRKPLCCNGIGGAAEQWQKRSKKSATGGQEAVSSSLATRTNMKML